MNAICGACGGTHPTIQDYRACNAATPLKPLSEVGARMARSAGIPAQEIEEGRLRWRNAHAEIEAERESRPATNPTQPYRQATITDRTDRTTGGYGSASREERKATEPMMRFVNNLIKYRAIDPVIVAETVKRIEEAPDGALPFRMAKLFIDAYKDAPNKPRETSAPATAAPALPDVPAGRYALRTDGIVKFYILDRPEEGKWAGYTFLKAQASDERYPIKNPTAKAEILGRIAEDIEGAAVLYGQELGRCYRCGRTLTDETSRELGIGPDCRAK